MLDALTLIALAAAVVSFWICIRDWRKGVFGLLAFMPFVGLPTILLYPAPAMTRLLKDVIFVAPAYIGFGVWYLKTRPSGRIPKLLTGATVLLTALAVWHMFDRDVPELLVALIGLKTWVLYIPLVFLGYHLVATTEQLDKLVVGILFVGALPIILGLLQTILISAGASDLAYRAYGAAGVEVTGSFGRTEVGTGDLAKVASTFTFISQYYNFTLAMLCFAYGHWRSLPRRSGSRFWFGFVPLAVVTLAGLTTGSRGAFVMIPLYFIIVQALDADWAGIAQTSLLFVAGLTAALLLVNAALGDLFDLIRELAIDYLIVTQFGEFTDALSKTVWGFGTGTNTGPARLVESLRAGGMSENYYAKANMELGIPGLALVVLIFVTILLVGFRRSRRLTSLSGQAYANALLAFVIISIVNGWKASYFDLDPLNVYFWLSVGLLLRIPDLVVGDPLSRDGRNQQLRHPLRPLWNAPSLSANRESIP